MAVSVSRIRGLTMSVVAQRIRIVLADARVAGELIAHYAGEYGSGWAVATRDAGGNQRTCRGRCFHTRQLGGFGHRIQSGRGVHGGQRIELTSHRLDLVPDTAASTPERRNYAHR